MARRGVRICALAGLMRRRALTRLLACLLAVARFAGSELLRSCASPNPAPRCAAAGTSFPPGVLRLRGAGNLMDAPVIDTRPPVWRCGPARTCPHP